MNAETKRLSGYLKKWKRKLGLREWILDWSWETQEWLTDHAGYPSIALSSVQYGGCHAALYFAKDFLWREHPGELEDTVIHELMHIAFHPLMLVLEPLHLSGNLEHRGMCRVAVESVAQEATCLAKLLTEKKRKRR